MIWTSLLPGNLKNLHLPSEDASVPDALTAITDLWIWATISLTTLCILWAIVRTWQSRQRTSRYLKHIEQAEKSKDVSRFRADWVKNQREPLAEVFNAMLVDVPVPGKPLVRELKRGGNASEVFNPGTLANGLVGSRFLLSVPSILTGLGVLGTFVGLQIGIGSLELDSSQIEQLDKSIAPIIKGSSTAFATSVWGVACSLIFTVIEKFLEWLALVKIRRLQNQLDGLIPRYTPEESMIEIQRAASQSEGILKELAVAIGKEMQVAVEKLGSSITQAVKETLGGQAQTLGDGAAKLMSVALTDELGKLQSAVTGMADGFKSEFIGASRELNTSITGFDTLLKAVDGTVQSSQIAMTQAVQRLTAHEEVVNRLEEGANRLKEAAVELTSMRDTFTLSAQRNTEAAAAQERAATVNESVADKLQLVGEKLPEVQSSLVEGSKMIASLGQPLLDLKELLSKTPEVFGGQLNTTVSSFETIIKGVDDTVRASRDAMNQAVERLTAHEDVVIQLKEGSIRLQEAATELSSMRDTFTLSAQKNSDAATAQEKAASVNESVAVKLERVGDKLPGIQEAIASGATVIASIGQPLLDLKEILAKTPDIFGQQAEDQSVRDEKRSSILLLQTEQLAVTVAAAASKFGQIDTLAKSLENSAQNLEKAGGALGKLADGIEKASQQHLSAAQSSEKAAIASERTADKLQPLPDSIAGLSGTLTEAGSKIREGADAAKVVYGQLLEHQKEWFRGIEVGLRAMHDQVQNIMNEYGNKVEGATRDHMVKWTTAVEESLRKFQAQVQALEGAINDLTSQNNP
jgi:methyl-accepting chemotaxis protein